MSPKGVYERTDANRPKPREYPAEVVALVRRLYLEDGLTVAEVSQRLPKGYKAQRIIERHIDQRRPAIKRNQTGPANATWRGDDVSYQGVHVRLVAQRGKASAHLCVDCRQAAQDWSYEGGSEQERRDGKFGLRYTTDLSMYAPRCRKCHRAHDRKGEGNV